MTRSMTNLPLRVTVVAFLFALATPIAARADDASHRAKAEELVTLNNTQKAVNQIAGSISAQVDQAAERSAGPDPTDEQKAKIEDFKKHTAELVDSTLGWTAMKSAVVDLYVKAFTEEQIDGILAFYKTPAGAAFIEKMPEINTQFGQLGNARVAGIKDQLQKSFQDLQNSLHPVPTLGTPASPAPATGGTK